MKKIVQMTAKEANKLHIIKEVAEGYIKQKKGAIELGISPKQMGRLVKKWFLEGDNCVIHGLKGKGSNNHEYNTDQVNKIIHSPEYVGFGPTFMQEKLHEIHKIKISVETMRKIMIFEGLRNPHQKEHYIYRHRRERRESTGDMTQFDGSYHFWFEDRGSESCLLVAIDDATSKLLHCKFTDGEGFVSVSKFWIEYILKHGIPKTIYVDKFSTYRVVWGKKREKEMITNFRRIMGILGCELIFANSAEAKGRVERVNKTLQDRLIKEMRLAGINNIETGNNYLITEYMPKHNKKFAVDATNPLDTHHKNQYTKEELVKLFAQVRVRSLGNDYIVQFKSEYYQILEGEYIIYPKKKIEVYETNTGEIYMKSNGKELSIRKLHKNTVQKQRIRYWAQQHKIQQDAKKARQLERQKKLYNASKQRQEERKQLELDLNISKPDISTLEN